MLIQELIYQYHRVWFPKCKKKVGEEESQATEYEKWRKKDQFATRKGTIELLLTYILKRIERFTAVEDVSPVKVPEENQEEEVKAEKSKRSSQKWKRIAEPVVVKPHTEDNADDANFLNST